MEKKEKIRKLFLDDLPRKEGIGALKGKTVIDWKNSIGCKIPFVYDDVKGDVKIIKYITTKQLLSLEYNDKNFSINTNNFLKCRIGTMINKRSKEFKINIGEHIIDDKRDLVITDKKIVINDRNYQKYNEKWYKYTCNKCTWTEGWIIEHALIKQKIGCSCCAGRVAVLGINTIWDTDRWLVDDFGLDEEFAKTHTCTTKEKGIFKCKDCGKEKKIAISNVYYRHTIACACGDGFSYPEKFMMSVLNQLNIEFETQYSPDYLITSEGKRYRKFSDFYLPNYKLVIEVDGGLGHKGGKTHSKSNKTLEELIEVDKWKDEQHKLHGVETIRIDCFESDMEYIKNSILNSKLNELFDLSNIDWLKAELYATKSNKVKEVCDYWNQKEDWETTVTIANNNKWGIKSVGCILNYLKKGTKLGWCDYNPKEELRKSVYKNGKALGKQVEMFKNNKTLGIFESCIELERQSEKLFGVKLLNGSISEVCNKKKSQYKGFSFKYV